MIQKIAVGENFQSEQSINIVAEFDGKVDRTRLRGSSLASVGNLSAALCGGRMELKHNAAVPASQERRQLAVYRLRRA